MAAPTPKTYFAPGHSWTTEDADVVWVEITSYVLLNSGLSTNRGRSSETDDDQAGTLRLRLKNSDRRFDPTHAAGPYFGNLKPGVPIKVEADADGNTYPIFRGFIDAWPQDYDDGNQFAWVSMSCTDGLARLALAGTPSSVLALEIAADSPDVWYRLNETAGTQMGDSSGGNRHGTYSSPVESTQSPNQWETVGSVAFSSDVVGTYTPTYPLSFPLTMEACFTHPDGNDDFHVVIAGDGVDSWGTIFLAGSGVITSSIIIGATEYALTGVDVTPGPVHVIASWTDASTAVLYLDGVVADSSVSSGLGVYKLSGIQVASQDLTDTDWADNPIADVAIYSTDLDATRAAAHGEAFAAPWDGDTSGERVERLLDAVGWPADLRDVATGLSTLGPAVLGDYALQLLKRCEGAEQGRLFVSRDGKLSFLDRYYQVTVTEGMTSQATFSDDGADDGYRNIAFDFDTTLVKNRVRASRAGGSEVEVTDPTSITTYGDRTDSALNGLDFNNDHQAQSAAEFRLAIYKEPALRVRPIVIPLHGMTDAEQAELLGLELGQRVTVERTPQGVGSAITQECSIEGIEHAVADLKWVTTFRLAPIPEHMDNVLLWDVGEWDTAVWGY